MEKEVENQMETGDSGVYRAYSSQVNLPVGQDTALPA